jgi:enterochelin esterase-like enzyme
MISTKIRLTLCLALIFALVCLNAKSSFAVSAKSQIVVRELRSENIAHNKTGTDPVRKMLVYLPASYDESSSQRYPVIYFLPNPFDDDYRFVFDHRDAQGLFAAGVIEKFILVAVDMNTPLGTSWYVNSSATGNWEDFVIQELVPYIDANFKTLPNGTH